LSEKTEEATPKKKREARRKGQVARSQEFVAVTVMLGAIAVLAVWSRSALAKLVELSTQAFRLSADPDLDRAAVTSFLYEALLALTWILAPLLAVTFAMAALFSALQVGFMLSLKPLLPDFQRLDPVKGAKNLVSMSKVVELIKNVLRLSAMAVIGFLVLRQVAPPMTQIPRGHLLDGAMAVTLAAVQLSLFLIGGLVLFGIFDLFWKRHEHSKKLRMAKHEVKREHKESEGDPHVKGQRKRFHRELARGGSMKEVKNADAVVVNPTHVAAALRYREEEMRAPRVLASGRGSAAREIKRLARRYGVPIVHNVELARALADVDLESEIPEELFEPVAEVLRFVYDLRERRE